MRSRLACYELRQQPSVIWAYYFGNGRCERPKRSSQGRVQGWRVRWLEMSQSVEDGLVSSAF
jgi:hypothetical protein